jgi:integrase
MAIHLLTDTAIQKAKSREKPYRIPDGGALYLYVAPSGTKAWQFRYRLAGRPLTSTLGKYPSVSLKEARDRASAARMHAEAGHQLTARKRIAKLTQIALDSASFGVVAAAWLDDEEKRKRWSTDYREEVQASLRNHLSKLNDLPILDVTAPVAAAALNKILNAAPLMFLKVHRRLRSIMDFAVEQGLLQSNPLPNRRPRVDRGHFPAVVDLPGIGEILRSARAADPCKGIQRAHLLLAFTAQRISEVVEAAWTEFDLDRGDWAIPRSRMKLKNAERGAVHSVPLPPVLLGQLHEWRASDGPGAKYVCVAPRDSETFISREAVEKFYRQQLGLAKKHSPHSWRSVFSTICNDAGKPGELVEAQLDHRVGNAVASAYDRAQRIELRRDLLAWYEGELIASRDGAIAIPLRARV